jgi:hypothetical protein
MLKQGLSIDTTFYPPLFSLDSTFKEDWRSVLTILISRIFVYFPLHKFRFRVVTVNKCLILYSDVCILMFQERLVLRRGGGDASTALRQPPPGGGVAYWHITSGGKQESRNINLNHHTRGSRREHGKRSSLYAYSLVRIAATFTLFLKFSHFLNKFFFQKTCTKYIYYYITCFKMAWHVFFIFVFLNSLNKKLKTLVKWNWKSARAYFIIVKNKLL